MENLDTDDAQDAIRKGYSCIKHASVEGDRMVALPVKDVLMLTVMASLWWQGE